ncbi:hypothetical protein GF342_04230 [Candidatus Woesearchaeota archaeon]|nr:hypothetical protein [Candidatus Woesearchaeota archaeon]
MKQGVQSVFTWIFILLAGGLILVFFITVGYRFYDGSIQTASIQVEQNLESALSLALQQDRYSHSILLGRSSVTFFCSNTCDCTFDTGYKGTNFRDNIFFAEPLIDGTLYLWSLPWLVPFRATNFLTVSSPEYTHYIVTGNAARGLQEELEEKSPKNSTIRFITPSEVSTIENGATQEKFIFLKSGIRALHPSFADEEVRAVELQGNTIQFLIKSEDSPGFEQQGQRIPILNDNLAMISAAMFSGHPDMFTCGLQTGYKKLNLVAQVLANKAKSMDGFTKPNGDNCYYDPSAVSLLNSISQHANTLSTNPRDSQSVSSLDQLYTQLEQLNNEREIESCPLIY